MNAPLSSAHNMITQFPAPKSSQVLGPIIWRWPAILTLELVGYLMATGRASTAVRTIFQLCTASAVSRTPLSNAPQARVLAAPLCPGQPLVKVSGSAACLKCQQDIIVRLLECHSSGGVGGVSVWSAWRLLIRVDNIDGV